MGTECELREDQVFYIIPFVSLLLLLPLSVKDEVERGYRMGRLLLVLQPTYSNSFNCSLRWRGWIMLPIKDKFFSVGRFFRYWLCAEWWPIVREALGRWGMRVSTWTNIC